MNKLLTEFYKYAEEVSKGGDIKPPSLDTQQVLKDTPEDEILMLGKSSLTLTELSELRNNVDDIPNKINEVDSEVDKAILAIIYFAYKLGRGKFVIKADLIIKIVARPYNVQEQINKAQALK